MTREMRACSHPLLRKARPLRLAPMSPPWIRTSLGILLLLLARVHAAGADASTPPTPTSLPNILILLADDLGFSDLGCYGGEIRTPNLDRLARHGLRFSQFYNTSRCWPSRAALLSGFYPQQIRMDPPRGRLPNWAPLLPRRLQALGYRSYHSGKWHVNGAPLAIADGGFNRSYRLEDHDRNFHPQHLWLDDDRIPAIPRGSNYYTTSAFADFMIGCLKDHAAHHSRQPFLGYLAFTVPHFPLQAPADDVNRCRGRYDAGWDVIRARRHHRQVRIGLVQDPLSPPEPDVFPSWSIPSTALKTQIDPGEVAAAVPWTSLTPEEQRFQAAKMAVHAAMIERMDREIGRVLDQLRTMNAIENTLILFASDNGASAEFINRGDRHELGSTPGSARSYLCLGPGWSTAANTPFRLHKSWTHEGGIATPLIVHWPRAIRTRGQWRHTPAHLIDVVPTLLDIAGPGTQPPPSPSPAIPSLPGRSLRPAFDADVDVARDYLYFHHAGNRALRVGDWKLVSRTPETNTYSLYNLRFDRTEQVDLAARQPDRAAAMGRTWDELDRQFRETADQPEPPR